MLKLPRVSQACMIISAPFCAGPERTEVLMEHLQARAMVCAQGRRVLHTGGDSTVA